MWQADQGRRADGLRYTRRTMLPRPLVAALIGLLASGAVRPASRVPAAVDAAIQQIDAARLHRDIAVLASDELSGRGVGHPGNHRAEQYIANALQEAGAAPVPPGSPQPSEVYEPHLGPDARLVMTSGAGAALADFRVGPDFYPLPESGNVPVTGKLVFAGHGVTAP